MHSAERLLKLLGLLEGRIDWTAEELARRLEVTPRTVRRDVTRLRDLGYPVAAVAGPGGGYRLGAGGKLPPLLLDDEEALVSALLAQRVCGLVLHNTTHNKRVRDLVAKTGVPVIEIGANGALAATSACRAASAPLACGDSCIRRWKFTTPIFMSAAAAVPATISARPVTAQIETRFTLISC